MQNNRSSHARRIFLGLGAALLLGLAGCQTPTITNLTPDALAENPSQIYTISARIAPKDTGYVPNSLTPYIIIGGKNYRMTKSPLGENLYEFEYQVPAGVTEIAYYFIATYQVESSGIISPREDYSPIHRANIAGRYVLSLEVNRGPVGARVSILGRGFTPSDTVYFDGTPVRTAFDSPNAISFIVPAVEGNRNYRVTLGGEGAQTPVGTFRVDAIGGGSEFGAAPMDTAAPVATGGQGVAVTASPASLSLQTGERTQVTFTSPVRATAGGLLIDVTTDVPESVIMPEVVIPAGQDSVTVTVEGGRPGTGSLFARGPGAREQVIPITVR